MKCGELASIVGKLQDLLKSAGGSIEATDALIRMLNALPNSTVAQLSKALSRLSAKGDGDTGQVRAVVGLIRNFEIALRGLAKDALLKDLATLQGALGSHTAYDVEEILHGLKNAKTPKTVIVTPEDAVVRHHLVALENALGDDEGFLAAYSALEKDPLVRNPEVLALAKRFAFVNVKTRTTALKKIWSRHQVMMIGRAKAAATAGRIAG